MRRTLLVSWLLPLCFLPLLTSGASARASDDAAQLLGALRAAQHCHAWTLLVGPVARCRDRQPAERHRELFDAIRFLSFGDEAWRAAQGLDWTQWRQLRCQLAIDAAVVSRVEDALRSERGEARRTHRRARRGRATRSAIERFCDVEVRVRGDGLELPHVGPQCAAAVGDPGTAVDASELRRCLEVLVDTWLDRWLRDERPRRPNIVVILTDDQRHDTIDATHSPEPEGGVPAMPAVMDRLAGEGVLFTHAFVTTPVCGASRASWLTGRYAHRSGVLRNAGVAGGQQFDDASTLATWLQGAGYRTGFYGKYMNAYAARWAPPAAIELPPGWDDFRAFDALASVGQYQFRMIENGERTAYGGSEPAYTTDVMAEQALAFIDESATDDRPFLVYFSTAAPHFPWDPAPRHIGAFAGATPWLPPSYFEPDVSDKPSWVQARLGFSFLQHFGVQSIRQRQLEMQMATDEFVDRLMDRLEELGVADDTMVVYSSDNGQAWGEHRWANKACPWDVCTRVPLVVRYPRLAPLPRVEESFALNIDLAPTLAELAGAPMTRAPNGESLVAALDGTLRSPRQDFLIEGYSGFVRTFAGIREKDWLYVGYLSSEEELYDLVEDPDELENLAGRPEHAERLREMRQRRFELWPGWFGIPF
jgi:arylsulfatase A-like enzyme